MDAKPFTFDAAIMQRVLDGRKTQSRRLDRKFNVGDLFRPTTPYLRDCGKCIDRQFVITRVWLEPVKEISLADIWAEGVDNGCSNPKMGKRHENMQRMAFESMIHKYYSGIWLRNGLVWAHEWRKL